MQLVSLCTTKRLARAALALAVAAWAAGCSAPAPRARAGDAKPARAELSVISESCGIDVACEQPGLAAGNPHRASSRPADAFFAAVQRVAIRRHALARALDAQLEVIARELDVDGDVASELETLIASAGAELAIVATEVECATDPALGERVRELCDAERDRPECEAGAAAEGMANAACRPPALTVAWNGDAGAETPARLERAVATLSRRLPGLLALAASAERVLQASTRLAAEAAGPVAESIAMGEAGEVNLRTLFGQLCAVHECGQIAARLGADTAQLETSLAAVADLTRAAGVQTEPAQESEP